MSHLSSHSVTDVYIRFYNGVCGIVKGIINIEVWESVDAITFVTENGSKISYPTDLLSEYCILGE